MRIDLENSPWAVVLIAALFCLILMTLVVVTLVVLQVHANLGVLIAAMGVWASLVGSALTIGSVRARRAPDSDTSAEARTDA